jgi:hypothetical protein
MRVPVRWSQCLDKASESNTFPRAIWSRYLSFFSLKDPPVQFIVACLQKVMLV